MEDWELRCEGYGAGGSADLHQHSVQLICDDPVIKFAKDF